MMLVLASSVILHIYGKDVSCSIIASISKIRYVKFMDYVNASARRKTAYISTQGSIRCRWFIR
jgi:hypothetical protein